MMGGRERHTTHINSEIIYSESVIYTLESQHEGIFTVHRHSKACKKIRRSFFRGEFMSVGFMYHRKEVFPFTGKCSLFIHAGLMHGSFFPALIFGYTFFCILQYQCKWQKESEGKKNWKSIMDIPKGKQLNIVALLCVFESGYSNEI